MRRLLAKATGNNNDRNLRGVGAAERGEISLNQVIDGGESRHHPHHRHRRHRNRPSAGVDEEGGFNDSNPVDGSDAELEPEGEINDDDDDDDEGEEEEEEEDDFEDDLAGGGGRVGLRENLLVAHRRPTTAQVHQQPSRRQGQQAGASTSGYTSRVLGSKHRRHRKQPQMRLTNRKRHVVVASSDGKQLTRHGNPSTVQGKSNQTILSPSPRMPPNCVLKSIYMAHEFDAVFGVKDRSLWDLHLSDPETDMESLERSRYLFYKLVRYWDKFTHKIDLSHQDQYRMYLITTLLPAQDQNALINKILPKELILRVFSYLDIVSLCRCAQVCRFWNKLAMDGSNWQDVDLFCFQRDVKAAVVENLARRCGGFLKILSLRGCENVQDSALRSFATKCPNIEMLILARCKRVTDATCEHLGMFCHRLISLDLENCTAITDTTMKYLSEGCKKLEELNISWCENITDRGIRFISKGCPKLKTLICKGCEGLSPACFAGLENDMQNLRKLNLLSCAHLMDETIEDISKGCHKLEFISLSNCREITDRALVALAHGCPYLKDIELAACTNLTDNGFIALSKNCHELERMDLEDCNLITDATLQNLNHGCPNLSSLALSHCELLTDTGLSEFCTSHREVIQVLELDNCPLITDAALDYMRTLKSLERVDLYDCALITKDAIKRFKQYRPDVEVQAYFAPATPPQNQQPTPNRICRCCVIL